MRPKPAPGGPEMIRALSNQNVIDIVSVMLQIIKIDQEFFKDVAVFIRTYATASQRGFADALNDLRTKKSADEKGLFTVSHPIDEFVFMLETLYSNSDYTLGFLRGAIVEKLVFELIAIRLSPSQCLSNHLFLDWSSRPVTAQIDVAAFSDEYFFVEGYECKISVGSTYGLMSEDCDNLKALVKAAHSENYRSHVGVTSFASDDLIAMKLDKFNAPLYIKAYGLNSIVDLRKPPRYILPHDSI